MLKYCKLERILSRSALKMSPALIVNATDAQVSELERVWMIESDRMLASGAVLGAVLG